MTRIVVISVAGELIILVPPAQNPNTPGHILVPGLIKCNVTEYCEIQPTEWHYRNYQLNCRQTQYRMALSQIPAHLPAERNEDVQE